MEKYILRKAFDLEGEKAYLPEEVLWRQKEQFSDGVGYDWVDRLREYASQVLIHHYVLISLSFYGLSSCE